MKWFALFISPYCFEEYWIFLIFDTSAIVHSQTRFNFHNYTNTKIFLNFKFFSIKYFNLTLNFLTLHNMRMENMKLETIMGHGPRVI